MYNYYEAIFKRKSVRKYDELLHLTEGDLVRIRERTRKIIPLDSSIKVKFELIPRQLTTAKRGEYCLLMYSEKKQGYLLNAGYMLQEMDLWFANENIGACWYGLAKPDTKKIDGLDYVIMLSIGRSKPDDFRSGAEEFNRKETNEIWNGEFNPTVIEAVRLSPSACNSQPWRYVSSANIITVYRYTKAKSIIPPNIKPFYNTIDIGISLFHLETALKHEGYKFEREIFTDEEKTQDTVKLARYTVMRA